MLLSYPDVRSNSDDPFRNHFPRDPNGCATQPAADGAGARGLPGELATLVREIDLYLTFWEHARKGRRIQSLEEQS